MHLKLEGKQQEILEHDETLVALLGQLDQLSVEVEACQAAVAREAAAREAASKPELEIKALCANLYVKTERIATLEADREAFVRQLAEQDEEIDQLKRQLGGGGSPPRRKKLSSSAYDTSGATNGIQS